MWNYVQKSDRGHYTKKQMLAAVRLVKNEGYSIRKSAVHFNLNYKTVGRYAKKFTDEEINNQLNTPEMCVGYVSPI